jgi:translation elongation factor EF-4
LIVGTIAYLGVVILVRVINGSIKKGMESKFHAANKAS